MCLPWQVALEVLTGSSPRLLVMWPEVGAPPLQVRAQQGFSGLDLVGHTGTSRPRYSGFSAVGVPSKVLGGDPRSAGSWSQ